MKDEPTVLNEKYPPSWINRFTSWVERLPIPVWLFYTILFVVWELGAFLFAWTGGELQWGEVKFIIFYYNFWGVALLSFHHYLEGEIRETLHETKPMLNVSADGFAELKYRFAIMPARPVLVWSIIGLGIGVYLGLVGFYEGEFPRLSHYTLFNFLNYGVSISLTLGFGYRLFRLLRMISKLYTSSTTINLYNLTPVYALSGLGSKAGLFLLILLYSNLVVGLVSGEGLREFLSDPFQLVGFALFSLLPLAAFFLPLRGINRRLVLEKRRVLSNVSRRLEAAFDQINREFDSRQLNNMRDLETSVSNLRAQKEIIEGVPTWPWRPATLRVFLSAVFLPIFIWLIQQVLDRFFSF